MRKDPIAAAGALVLVVGFVLVLGDMTGLLFGRQGPFDLETVEEEWTTPEGGVVQARSEVITFRGKPLFIVRAMDGDMTPALRAAPIPDSLNRVARSMGRGEAMPDIVIRDIPGLDLELARVSPGARDTAFLIRITPDDAVMERSRGDALATADGVSERWRAALQDAFRFVADSVAATTGGAP